ncbi:THAP domain-containing protein 9, partial [Aphis craccivora]
LPHPSSITHWTSSVDAEPGFLEEVFEYLKNISPSDRDCNLNFDAMSIRKKIIYDSNKSQETPASEALIFMLVSLNGKWKWPIGYFFQSKSTATIQAGLVTTAITMAHAVGIKVWGVSCDDTAFNLSTMTHLGCKLFGSYDEIKESFYIPGIEWKIHYIPDACHNLKLARNALATYTIFKNENGVINWNFIEELHKTQQKMGLNFANKISASHIDWRKNIMKVKLVAETLSSSTADALEVLNCLNIPKFKNVEETIKFTKGSKFTTNRILEKPYEKKVDSSECEENFDDDNLTELDLDDGCFDVLKDNVLNYICGFIVKKIFKKIDCTTFAESLLEDQTLHSYCHKNSFSVFADLKTRCGLVKSSVDVMKIATFVEFTLIELTNNLTNLSCEDDSFLENHILNLVTLICKLYLKIRLHYAAKLKTAITLYSINPTSPVLFCPPTKWRLSTLSASPIAISLWPGLTTAADSWKRRWTTLLSTDSNKRD